jgi:hypothetical protein
MLLIRGGAAPFPQIGRPPPATSNCPAHKTEAVADAVLSNPNRVMVQRRKGSRLRIVPLCVAETTAVCRGAVIIAGLPCPATGCSLDVMSVPRAHSRGGHARGRSPSASVKKALTIGVRPNRAVCPASTSARCTAWSANGHGIRTWVPVGEARRAPLARPPREMNLYASSAGKSSAAKATSSNTTWHRPAGVRSGPQDARCRSSGSHN